MELTGSAADTLTLQHSAYCLLRQLQVYVGSTRIQNVLRYDRYMVNHLDVHMTRNQCASEIGMDKSTSGVGQGVDAINGTTTYTFSLPLRCVFSTLHAAFPLGRVMSNVRIDLTFNRLVNALTGAIAGTTTAYKVKDLQLVYEEISLPMEISPAELSISFEQVETFTGKKLSD